IGDIGCFSLQFNKIITAGEGGLMATNDTQLWQRALMYHDVIGGLRNNFPTDATLWGVNYRMPELLAAVALVQLQRLDGLLHTMRSYKRTIQTALTPLLQAKGLYPQELPDPAGDAGIAFIFFAHTPQQAQQLAQAIAAENVEAYTLYQPDEVDYHVYTHWVPIVQKRAWSKNGGPWAWAARPIDYSPAACPRTLDLLARAVHIDVNPLLSGAEIEAVIEALEKVVTRYG
ncbi:MAG: DegT/DnrJ/EryC1/StrS family aminotransferase, partial [Anaerolineales bacterium]|nr:DegT/DnrJ/EryC1/StrS family aminotransferase [Anaerolineales bacterium]